MLKNVMSVSASFNLFNLEKVLRVINLTEIVLFFMDLIR
jgi:hypothetical protein